MARTVIKGLNWGHRRATTPLDTAASAYTALNPDIGIEWSQRSLAGFVSERMEDVVDEYDLIVFDHPFTGTLARDGLFLPLEQELPDYLGAGRDALWAGPSLRSYHNGGHIWGAPVDAAVQNAILRPDLLEALDADCPTSWAQSLELGRKARAAGKYVALALASPHAYLTFLALYANLGTGVADDLGPDADLNPERAEAALLAMTEHVALGPAEQADWDSIALHDAMSTTDDVVFCPCEFGYATYGETDNTNRLAFSAFAGPRAPHERGAVLGGAAIGISARTRLRAPALDFVRYLLTPETQALLSARHGQAAYAPIWSDAAVDARFNGYFSSVRSTIDSASIRPRFADFIPFQLKAGNIVRAAAIGEMSISAALERLQQLTDEARAATA